MRQVFLFFPIPISGNGKRWLDVSITRSPEVPYGQRDGQSITDGAGWILTTRNGRQLAGQRIAGIGSKQKLVICRQ